MLSLQLKHECLAFTKSLLDRSRLIVVRDPDGTLRKANWDEQDRLNEIYFPREGRKHYTPQALDPDHLETLLVPHKVNCGKNYEAGPDAVVMCYMFSVRIHSR